MGVLDIVDLRLVRTMGDAADFLEWLGRRRDVLGIDTETGGFDHKRDPLRMVQFGDLEKGWAIPWHRWSGLAVEAIKRYDGPVVFHNSPFDVKFLMENSPEIANWPWDRTNDTLTMAHLVDPLRSKNLKAFAAMHVDPSAAAAQRTLDEKMAVHKWTFATVPYDLPDYAVYAAMDPVLTAYVYDKLKDETINGSCREAYGLEIGVLRVVTNMMRKGALVDLDYCQQKIHEFGDKVGAIVEYLAAEHGIRSVDSNDQIGRAFERLDVEVPVKYTPGGKQSWDKEVLELIDHDLARYILGARKMRKMVGTYFRSFMADADSDGRVHATIWSLGTRHGRQTVTDPPLQTLHKKDPTIRHAFVPAPGNVLITIDADQIEARLMAIFSKDPGMIAAFADQSVDFFVALARQIFLDPGLQKDDRRRDLTKNTIYGRIYGAGAANMAATSRVTLDQMQTFIAIFNEKFPGVERFQREINDVGMARKRAEGAAYVITPYGRRLPSDELRDYTLLNYLISGHAAEILKLCLCLLDARGFGEFMVLPVHDEIVMEVPEDIADEVLRESVKIMNDAVDYTVPITWSGDILDKSWGQKYE